MELVFDRRGSGEPLLLLHGLGSRWQVFEPVIDRLARDFAVYALDLPGFGASPAPVPPIASMADLADRVHEWMREQGIEGCHVAGNSTGGGVALELASRGAVASAIALAPVGFWSRQERVFCQTSMRNTRAIAGATRRWSRLMASNPAIRFVSFRQYLAHPGNMAVDDIVDSVAALADAPAFEDVSRSFDGYLAPADAADHVPVTIVWGAKDLLLLPRQARRARARLPKARHVLLEDAGHLMMFDAPEEVATLIAAGTRAPVAEGASPTAAPTAVI